MYEHTSLPDVPNIFLFRITGGITTREKTEISQFLEQQINKSGTIRLILVISYYETTDNAEALFDDLGFVKLHSDNIERMAVVGNKAGQDTWVGLFGLFGGIEAEYFDASEMEKAEEWVRKI